MPQPSYAHIPIAANQAGEKLSKQTAAPAIDDAIAAHNLFQALDYHGQNPPEELLAKFKSFIHLDVLDYKAVENTVKKYNINVIYQLASLLSATGEKNPQFAWDLNINGLINVLEVSRKNNVKKIVWPSSIAALGPTTPRDNTPNETILQPTTMYGITKVSGELLIKYYSEKYWNLPKLA